MKKYSIDIKTIIIFSCVLLKYLIEYKIETQILYFLVLIISLLQLIRMFYVLKGTTIIIKTFVIFIFSAISVIVYKDVNLLITFILALTLINCDFKDFLKKFMVSSLIMYITTITLYFVGILPDNYLIRVTSNGEIIRHSLGFSHPNSIFMYYIPIVLCAYLLDDKKKRFYIIFSILSLILYLLSLSRSGIICIIILFVLIIIMELMKKSLKI